MKMALLVAVFGLVSLFATAASADFVCAATYFPVGASGTLGNNGAVAITLNTAANCAGTQTGIRDICTAGATSTVCPAGVVYSEAALLNMYQALVHAVDTNIRISGQVATCIGGGTACWTNISFLAN
jgi:hypothetical protein